MAAMGCAHVNWNALNGNLCMTNKHMDIFINIIICSVDSASGIEIYCSNLVLCSLCVGSEWLLLDLFSCVP